MSSKSHTVCWQIASDAGEHSTYPGLHWMPQFELTHVAIPVPLAGDAQTVPHAPQFIGSFVRFRQPAGQTLWPVGQVAQSVPAVLHPLVHWLVVATHIPVALHVPCIVTTPPVHDWGGPHCAPAPLLPLSVQTEAPVAHDVTPVLQGLVGWQAWPAVHDTHIPVLQTRFIPHAVPSA